MLRLLINRLLAIPFVVLLINFAGFAYAYLFSPVAAAYNPYSSRGGELPPLLPEYIAYMERILQGDLGTLSTGASISSAVWRAFTASAGLLLIALILSAIIGLLLGMWAVRSEPPRISSWLTILSTIGLASPGFYIGIILVSFSIMYVIWGPGLEPLFPFQGFGWDAHLVLPTLALMALPTVKIAQVTSGLMVGELRKQYVVAARSFGHTEQDIRWRLAFRNIIVPVFLTISASMRFLTMELIIIERLFSWPGLGRLLSTTLVATEQSENFLHPPLLAALLALLALFFLFGELAATLLARTYDPRLGEAS